MAEQHFDTLWATSSTGKTKQWRVSVFEEPDHARMVITHGYVDSKETVNERKIYGKNIGKSNETTPFEQAVSEAESRIAKQLDKGYTRDQIKLTSPPKLPRPMLAHVFHERQHYVTYPAYMQPKLNGMRCTAWRKGDTVELRSRANKLIDTCPHLETQLLAILKDGESRDGEIYVHGWTFQEIMRAVKKAREETTNLEFHMYDVPSEGTFEDRFVKLDKALPKNLDNKLHYVPTVQVADKKAALDQLDAYLAAGYEGGMLRNTLGLYKFGHRSNDLLKLKTFVDAEFQVVGVSEGTGKDEGTAIFTCVTDGKEFQVRPTGTHEERAEYLTNFARYDGKRLTVKYQDLSEDGIPIFPVGVGFRPQWDL